MKGSAKRIISKKKRKYRRLKICIMLTLIAAGYSLYLCIESNSAVVIQERGNETHKMNSEGLAAELISDSVHKVLSYSNRMDENSNYFNTADESSRNIGADRAVDEDQNSIAKIKAARMLKKSGGAIAADENKNKLDRTAAEDEGDLDRSVAAPNEPETSDNDKHSPDEPDTSDNDKHSPDESETSDNNRNNPNEPETADNNENSDEPAQTAPDKPDSVESEPEKITTFSASADKKPGKKSAYISWERVKGAVSYEVQRSKKKDGSFRAVVSLGGNRRKYTDVKISRGQRYFYRVAAVMEDGNKIYSGTLSFDCALERVSGIKLIRYSTSSIKVTWNQDKDAKYYKVYCSKNKSGKYQYAGTTQKSWYRVKDLENNQFYYFRVKACAAKKASKRDSELSEVSQMRTMTYNRTTVFAGDSITTGLAGYGILDEIDIGGNKDVIAAVGLNTITFRSKRIFAGQSGMERIILYKPYRVYIMLGINEINYRSWEDVIQGNKEIVEGIQAGSPNTDIVLLATPPVTLSRLRKENGFSQIPAFNQKLEELAESMGVRYYDFTGFLKDSNGCLKSDYASGDGYHWKLAAYHTYAELIEAYDKSLD